MISLGQGLIEGTDQENRHGFSKKRAGRQTARKMPQQRGLSRSYNARYVPLLMGCPRSARLRSCIRCTKRDTHGRRTERGAILAERSKKGKMGRSIKVKIPIRRGKKRGLSVPMCRQNEWVYLYGVKMRRVPIRPFLILAPLFNQRAYLHARIINTFVATPAN